MEHMCCSGKWQSMIWLSNLVDLHSMTVGFEQLILELTTAKQSDRISNQLVVSYFNHKILI